MNKPIDEKLRILSDAAKYDVSCSSSGSNRKNTNNGLGNAAYSGICHSWSADGRCVSLLKILMTNYCIYDCKYCISRKSNDIERAILTPDEIVRLTMNFYRRNYIEGLFLSSGVIKNADYTMEQMIAVAKKLRLEENFNGYIHMKVIPGASRELIHEIGLYVDRVSVNIELAENKALKLLAPDKKPTDISTSMGLIRRNQIQNTEEKKLFKSTPSFIPAGQTTQMIIGAGGESDFAILNRSENLYKNFGLKRVYYSAYVPVNKSGILANTGAVPMLREHRIYQADWLLRFYNFKAEEILDEKNPFIDPLLDPKANWAVQNWHLFPMEINRAPYKDLIRIPGIGVTSAKRIVMARRHNVIKYEHLKKLGVVIKRAKYFITVNGEFIGFSKESPELIRNALIEKEKVEMQQLKLFNI